MDPTGVVLFLLLHTPYVWQRVGVRSQENQEKGTRKKINVVTQQGDELVGENKFFPLETT